MSELLTSNVQLPRAARVNRRNLLRGVGNAAAVLASNVVVKASTFVIYALVARHLDAERFGQLSLGLSLLYLFQMLAIAGLQTLITREVARHREGTDRYLIHASVAVIVTALLSFGGMLLFVRLMGYSAQTTQILFLLFLGLLPYTWSQVCEGVFQAWERMHYITYANAPINLLRVLLVYWLLTQGYGVEMVVLVYTLTYWLLLVVEWGILLRYVTRPRWQLDLAFFPTMLRASSAFFGIEALYTIKSSVEIIVLTKLTSETDAGLYSAAMQVMVPVTLIINNVVHSLFPLMCRKYNVGMDSLRWVAEGLLEGLMLLVVPAVVGIFVLAEPLLLLLYGDPEFLQAAWLLLAMIGFTLVNATNTVWGHVLWASRQEKVSLQIAAVVMLLKLVTSLLFISQFGLAGVVYSTLVVSMVSLSQHYLPVSKLCGGITLMRPLWKPTVAAAGMAGYLLTLPTANLFWQVISGAAIYSLVLALLFIGSAGGLSQFRARYQFLWSTQ